MELIITYILQTLSEIDRFADLATTFIKQYQVTLSDNIEESGEVREYIIYIPFKGRRQSHFLPAAKP